MNTVEEIAAHTHEQESTAESELQREARQRDLALHDFAAACFAANARQLMRAHGVSPALRCLLADELDTINRIRRSDGRGNV